MLAVSASPRSPLCFLPVLNPRPPLICPLRRRCVYRHRVRRQGRGGGGGLPLHLLHAVAGRRTGIVIDVDEVKYIGDRDLPVDVSFTRRLPPVLTLVDGIAALRRATEEVKASPPAAGSGVIRFEVLVPPSTKALNWLCSQFRRSSLFPQFYVSRKLSSDPSIQLEISGVGSALCLHGSSHAKNGCDLISRYISSDSELIGAYGAVGMKFDKELLSIEENSGSFYFFIPQVELTEFDGYSLLSSTMVWDHYVYHTFEDSICLAESCFNQVCGSYDSTARICYEGMMTSYIGESYLLETGNAQLVYLDAEVLAKVETTTSMQKENFLMPKQSFIRFSPQFLFSANMYFCIAPGSRSSPLALSATGHPLTTCISCYDERSLGFHAVGYGRGSRKPAVVITSSGTAVSNLFPSVVEASQDFIPVVLLTADRPPELHDAGANQAINQVNHFGNYVRYFFNLPPPGDQMYARMVLTTVDSAAYNAMQAPQGPVHINCAFREPLDHSNQGWSFDCLRGLDRWFRNNEPYTKYLGMKMVSAFGNYSCSVIEVLDIIKKAKQGLLLVGAIHKEDDMWAVALLARHLSWPVAADILSGLRMRKVLNSFPEHDKSILFIDHIDQILLSDSVKSWINPDVIVQVSQEILFHVHSEFSLTEPYVAHVIGEALYGDAVMFVGNSMVIRDLNMFGKGWLEHTTNGGNVMMHNIPEFVGATVAGNRGASGIDGLLSTAIGFAAGSNKHVCCVVGDISFLHDTNGLSLLNQRDQRKPMTIIVINNHGGAIFSLLPVAKTTSPQILQKYFYTSHDISISKLCAAHRVKHFLVQTKSELQDTLLKTRAEHLDCVVEVENRIDENANFHRTMSMFVDNTATNYLDYLLGGPYSGTKSDLDGIYNSKIRAMEYMLYRIQLSAPRTSGSSNSSFSHEGFILKLRMDENIVGFGEVAPIEIHEEDIIDVEEQLRFLFHKVKDCELNVVPLLRGSFSNWIWTSIGIPPSSVFPSVKCGLEMAILNLFASQRKCGLPEILTGSNPSVRDQSLVEYNQNSSTRIQICALLDSYGTPMEVALAVAKLVDEGFTTVKLKVGRRETPAEDAAVIEKIREVVGYKINIRADANRKWTYEQAIEFSSSVKSFSLQYIEEPVSSVDDLIKYCENSGLPVALDESIDNLKGDPIDELHQFVHPGIVAVVIKPSVVGGFESAALIAKWAHMHDKMAVISSAYESSVGLATYIQFAYYIDRQHDLVARIKRNDSCGSVAHGLGTYQWLREDVSEQKLKIHALSLGDGIGASVEDAHGYLQHLSINNEKIERTYSEEKIKTYSVRVDGDDFSYLVNLQEAGDCTNDKVVLFLHGFLGTNEDWTPMMKALSPSARVIAVDLPGHGESQILQHDAENFSQISVTVHSIADLLLKLICNITDGEVVVVGYSMGARIALRMALNQNHKISGAVLISGSPGLQHESSRRRRTAIDKSRAEFLLSSGLECFVNTWYSGKMWASLREHPQFDSVVRTRMKHRNITDLSKVLADSSIGGQKSLWEDLKHLEKPLLVVAGEKDVKFKEISEQMCSEIRKRGEGEADCRNRQELCEMVVVPESGHAVHVENPLPLVRAIRKFLVKLHGT